MHSAHSDSRPRHINTRKNLNFKATSDTFALVQKLVEMYYSERGQVLRKDEMRRKVNELVAVIEDRIRRIPLSAVRTGSRVEVGIDESR